MTGWWKRLWCAHPTWTPREVHGDAIRAEYYERVVRTCETCDACGAVRRVPGRLRAVPTTCPVCGADPFDPFLRWTVLRWGLIWRPWIRKDQYAVICRACKRIVGWEEEIDTEVPR